MLRLLLISASSFFVPYTNTEDCVLDIADDRELKAILPKSVNLILYIEEAVAEDHAYAFSSISSMFSRNATFLAITKESAPKYFSKYGSSYASIAFFKSGKLFLSFAFPKSDSELFSAVTFFMSPPSLLITSEESLYTHLGESQYTIVSTQSLFAIAQRRLISFSPQYGPITLATVSEDLLKKLGFSGKKVCLYRKTDKFLTEVDEATDSFARAFRPSFLPKLTEEVLSSSASTLAVLVVDAKSLPQDKDLLSRLGSQFSKYSFGIVNISESAPIKKIITQTPSPPFFIMCDFSELYCYKPIVNLSYNLCKDYIHLIENKSVAVTYASEPIPTSISAGNVTKVVGDIYEKFVTDKYSDCVVFYLNENNDFGVKLAKNLSDYVRSKKVFGLKIGMINVRCNSAKIGFPYLISDCHIQIFPAGRKWSNSSFIGSQTLYSLVNFVNNKGTVKIPVDEALFNPDVEMSYLIHFSMELESFPDEIQKQMLPYISSMGFKFGFGYTADEVLDHIYEMRGLNRERELNRSQKAPRRRWNHRRVN